MRSWTPDTLASFILLPLSSGCGEMSTQPKIVFAISVVVRTKFRPSGIVPGCDEHEGNFEQGPLRQPVHSGIPRSSPIPNSAVLEPPADFRSFSQLLIPDGQPCYDRQSHRGYASRHRTSANAATPHHRAYPPGHITHASGSNDCFEGAPVRSVLNGMMSGPVWR